VGEAPPASAPVATGELVIVTNPAGAIVSVDGKEFGAAPVHVTGLLPGSHLLAARTATGETAQQVVDVVAGRSMVVNLQITPAIPSPPPAATVPATAAESGGTASSTAVTAKPATVPIDVHSPRMAPEPPGGWTGSRKIPWIWLALDAAALAGVIAGTAIAVEEGSSDTDYGQYGEVSSNSGDPLPGIVTAAVSGTCLLVFGVITIGAFNSPGPAAEAGARYGKRSDSNRRSAHGLSLGGAW
jgi:hypothetical protein